MDRLILIRHGKTEANSRFLYCGSTDISLSKDGIDELNRIRENYIYPDISGMSCYTSGMIRAEQTLNLLFGPVVHLQVPEFKEMNFGDFEMKSYDDLKDTEKFKNWFLGDKSVQTPNGESSEQFEERVIKGLERVIDEKEVLIVCHGGTISRLMRFFFPNDNKDRYAWQPTSGAGYEITFLNAIPITYRAIPEQIRL